MAARKTSSLWGALVVHKEEMVGRGVERSLTGDRAASRPESRVTTDLTLRA